MKIKLKQSVFLAALVASLGVFSQNLFAANYRISSTIDGAVEPCSSTDSENYTCSNLRSAIVAANTRISGNANIYLNNNEVYSVNCSASTEADVGRNGDLEITQSISIETATPFTSRAKITCAEISPAGDRGRLFKVLGSAQLLLYRVNLDSVMQANGSSYYLGGGIETQDNADVRLSQVEITHAVAASGGAIYHRSNVRLLVQEVSLNANRAQSNGGGLYLERGELYANAVTFSNNLANRGAGLYLNSNASIYRSTIAKNTSVENGAGLYLTASSGLTLKRVTVAYNQANMGIGGIYAEPPAGITAAAALFAGNKNGSLASDCQANVNWFYSLIETQENATCPVDLGMGNQVNIAAKLSDTLQNRGGYTQILPLFPDSPAINRGMDVNGTRELDYIHCDNPTAADQRLYSRPARENCDVGSYEFSQSLVWSANQYSVNENVGTVQITINRVGGSDGEIRFSVDPQNALATSPSDYNGTSIPVVMASGQSSVTVEVPIVDDTIAEETENFTVKLTGVPTSLHVTNLSSEVLIIDNDGASTRPDFNISLNPAASSVDRGTTASTTLNIAALNGFNRSSRVTATGLPNGVTFTAVDVAAGATNAALTFNVAADAALGTHSITVVVTDSEGNRKTVTYLLTVRGIDPGLGDAEYSRLEGDNKFGCSLSTSSSSNHLASLLLLSVLFAPLALRLKKNKWMK